MTHRDDILLAALKSAPSLDDREREIMLAAWKLAEEIAEIRRSHWDASKARVAALGSSGPDEIRQAMYSSIQEQYVVAVQCDQRQDAFARQWEPTSSVTRQNDQRVIAQEQPTEEQNTDDDVSMEPESPSPSEAVSDNSDDLASEVPDVPAQPISPLRANQSRKRGSENVGEFSTPRKIKAIATDVGHSQAASQVSPKQSSERPKFGTGITAFKIPNKSQKGSKVPSVNPLDNQGSKTTVSAASGFAPFEIRPRANGAAPSRKRSQPFSWDKTK